MATKIPIVLSAPTALSPEQKSSYDHLCVFLENENFERRALGRSDYPTDCPLREVYTIAKHCSGGIILGFSQHYSTRGISKKGTKEEKVERQERKFPTPWNQLEAGILFALRLPIMVFREDGISGGVFDQGVTDVFINKLPLGGFPSEEAEQVRASIQNWAARVREHYRKW